MLLFAVYYSLYLRNEQEAGKWVGARYMIRPERSGLCPRHVLYLALYCYIDVVGAAIVLILFLGEVRWPDRDQGPETL